jgi:hypothetical protein
MSTSSRMLSPCWTTCVSAQTAAVLEISLAAARRATTTTAPAPAPLGTWSGVCRPEPAPASVISLVNLGPGRRFTPHPPAALGLSSLCVDWTWMPGSRWWSGEESAVQFRSGGGLASLAALGNHIQETGREVVKTKQKLENEEEGGDGSRTRDGGGAPPVETV